jgi:arylsulfatase A-like enzyme
MIFKRQILPVFLCFIWLAGCSGPQSNREAPTSIPTPYTIRIPAPTAPVTILPKQDRPNIILILVDDLDSKLGTIEFMPNLQKLMIKQGLSIKDFFVSDTTCCPSRSTILRGQYTHNHQVYTSNPIDGFERFYSLDHDSSTIATWLHAADYQTIYLGKYLNGYPNKSYRTYIPQGWDQWYSPARGKPYVGFNYTLNENGNLVDYVSNPQDYLLDVLSVKMQDFLRDSGRGGKPFFMFFAPFQPHQPANPAPRHANLFESIQAPRTESYNEADVQDKPETIRFDPLLTDPEMQNLDDLYRLRVQSMQSVDEMIANMFKVLEETNQIQNTYIIFTSDNGFHLGQHRLRAGKSTPYEEDINVPFIIFGPGIPANVMIDGYLAGNVDIAATISELAGVVPLATTDGRSLIPLFGVNPPDPSSWRQAYLLEYYADNTTEEGNNVSLISYQDQNGVLEPPDIDNLLSNVPTLSYRGLRTPDYLYVEYANGFLELYDLRKDPSEMVNIAGKVEQDLLDRLSNLLHRLAGCRGASCLQIESGQLP